MAKKEQVLFHDHDKIKENVQHKLIMYIVQFSVKKGYRFSRPQPGCHQPNSGLGEFGEGKILTFFPVYCPSRFRGGWKAFLLRGRAWQILKGEFCIEIIFCYVQERVNSFPPPAARSPPVSVTEFQPPYFPPPFSTASMALQQAKQLSTWIGQKIETALNVKNLRIIRGLFFTLWNCSILQILLNLPVLKAVLCFRMFSVRPYNTCRQLTPTRSPPPSTPSTLTR